ncbi:hypothetical protein KCU98_g12866, partial [Aureobasidium melanogenum]
MSPINPLRTSIAIGVLQKPAASEKTAKMKSEPTNNDFRPKQSASLPNNSKKAPPANVLAELIQVISAVVMPKSAPTEAEMTETAPLKKAPIAIAMVAVNTNSTSCVVDLKQGGRPSGFEISTVEGTTAFSSTASIVAEAGATAAAAISTVDMTDQLDDGEYALT